MYGSKVVDVLTGLQTRQTQLKQSQHQGKYILKSQLRSRFLYNLQKQNSKQIHNTGIEINYNKFFKTQKYRDSKGQN